MPFGIVIQYPCILLSVLWGPAMKTRHGNIFSIFSCPFCLPHMRVRVRVLDTHLYSASIYIQMQCRVKWDVSFKMGLQFSMDHIEMPKCLFAFFLLLLFLLSFLFVVGSFIDVFLFVLLCCAPPQWYATNLRS